MKQRLPSFVKKSVYWLCYILSYPVFPILFFYAHQFGELTYLSDKDCKTWRNAMASLIRECYKAQQNHPLWKIIYTFVFSKITVIKRTNIVSENIPVVVMCVKNDLKKMQLLLSHYRRLGVEKFAILDNGSDDGTFDWLKQQKDVDLFTSFQKYQRLVKEGWINRIISYYGFDHWYILTDSDELMTFIGMEEHTLNDVINYAGKENIKRFKGLTIDMYSDGVLFEHHDNILEKYKWFDLDTYAEQETLAGNFKFRQYIGGPRGRLMKYKVILSKYPLCFFEEGTVSVSAHYQYPFDLLEPAECYMGILHYKFLGEDLAKYTEIANFGLGYWDNGNLYKLSMDYIRKQKQASFMYDQSAEYVDSYSLRKIQFIKEMKFVKRSLL